MSLSTALNISSRALTVNQYALDVVSNNIANMSTNGYSKQRINLGTATNEIPIGDSVYRQILSNNGVQVESVTRYNNQFLKDYFRSQLSQSEYLNQSAGLASELDGIMNELSGNGLDATLSAFYESLNNLNEYPADSTARMDFIEKSKTLVSKFASLSQELEASSGNAMGDGTLGSMQSSLAYSAITDLNGKLRELADLNSTINRVQTGSLAANNLQDKKDVLLNDLSKFFDFTVTENDNGTVNLSLGEMSLVEGEKLKGTLEMELPETFYKKPENVPLDAPKAIINIVKDDGTKYGNINSEVTSGQLGALVQSENIGSEQLTASKVIAELDKLANSIANTFNEIQTRASAYCLSSDWSSLAESTEDLFTGGTVVPTAGGGTKTVYTAASIKVNSEIESKPYLIATAYFDAGTEPDLKAVGNSDNVIAMLATRNDKTAEGLGGMSIEEFYTSLIGKIGIQSSTGAGSAEAQAEVVDSLENKITSESSVDLNEELTDLIKYQTAFTAAARVFNTCNDCMETLVYLGS